MLADRNSNCHDRLLLVASNILYASLGVTCMVYVRCSNVTCHKSKFGLLTFLMSYVMCDVGCWGSELVSYVIGVYPLFSSSPPAVKCPSSRKVKISIIHIQTKVTKATPLHPITESINIIPLIITKSTYFSISNRPITLLGYTPARNLQ